MQELFKLVLSILGAIFALVFTILFAIILYRKDRNRPLFKQFSGPYRYPIIGTALELNFPREEFFKAQFRYLGKYGDRLLLSAFGFSHLTFANPDDVQQLLSSSVNINKGFTYQIFKPWLGNGLLTSRDEKWQKQRKLLTPSFHFRILEDFLVVFNEQAQILVDVLQKEFSNGQPKDFCEYISRCALDITGETIMGTNIGSQYSNDTPYFKAVKKALAIQARRMTSPLLFFPPIFWLSKMGQEYRAALKILHFFRDKVIEDRKSLARKVSSGKNTSLEEIDWKPKQRLAFLDLLLDAQKNPENELSDLNIREQVDTFIFAGHDTISSGLSWTIFLLSCHPKYQAKVHKELDDIFGDEKTRPITSKHLMDMKYLSACINEALRLYPSVPFVSRHLTKDLVLHDGLKVPAGNEVCLCIAVIHRNEKYFPNPNEYLPDRFLPDYTSKRHSYSYIPFSTGPRNCLGQKFAMLEMKTLLANIFRNFKAEAAETLEDVVVMADIITHARDGLKIKLTPR